MVNDKYKIHRLDYYSSNKSKLVFVKIEFKKGIGRNYRRKLIYKIIDNANAKGLIELYETCIINKSKDYLYGIIVY